MDSIRQSGRWRQWLLVGVLLGATPGALLLAEEFVELNIPLQEGRFFSLREVCRECNRALGAHFDLDSLGDRQFELTAKKRQALQALRFLPGDSLDLRATPDLIRIRFRNREDETVRRRIRRLIGACLGIDLAEWPAHLGLHPPDGFDPARRSVLLIHGLESGSKAFDDMARSFALAGLCWLIAI